MKKIFSIVVVAFLSIMLVTGCSSQKQTYIIPAPADTSIQAGSNFSDDSYI